jgi:hypothetical protein
MRPQALQARITGIGLLPGKLDEFILQLVVNADAGSRSTPSVLSALRFSSKLAIH